jgi:hypothetical protein
VTETNKIVNQPSPKPPPAAKNAANQPAVPVAKEKQAPAPSEPKKDAKVEMPDPKALPDKTKKKEEAKSEPDKDFSSVLKNLLDAKDTPPAPVVPDAPANKKAAAEPGQNAPLGQRMTMSEEDALRNQLERCWNVPFGAKDAENMIVEIFMVINPDRTLREARVVNLGRYNSDSFFRAAADSALRAVRSPLCSPFHLPPDKYNTWSTVTVTFNPRDMF